MEVNMLTFNLKRFWLYTKLIFCYQIIAFNINVFNTI